MGFLGEYGQGIERQERMASFYHIERRYSAFLQLHNEVLDFILIFHTQDAVGATASTDFQKY